MILEGNSNWRLQTRNKGIDLIKRGVASMRQQNQRNTKVRFLIIAVLLSIMAILLTGCGASLEDHWILTGMTATPERIEGLSLAEQRIIEEELEEILENLSMEIQFFEDGTGLLDVGSYGYSEREIFEWRTEGDELILITEGVGIQRRTIEESMAFNLSGSSLRLTNAEDGIIMEFQRVR